MFPIRGFRTGFSLVMTAFLLGSSALVPSALAQPTSGGTITGRVVFARDQTPVHGATILLVGAGKSSVTDDDGRFTIANVAPGTYDIVAIREHLSSGRQSVTVTSEGKAEANFSLDISQLHEEITVTASVGPSTTFEAFNAVTTLDSFEIAKNISNSLGEVLEGEAGIAKRGFGPGSSRPIIRGFDGDRVLILENGVRTADLSSQSGDHATTLDPGSVERIEIVRGPATLLYGSNAVGGVVNAITPAETFESSPFSGVHGQASFDSGSTNDQVGGNAGVQVGQQNWLVYAGGGSRRTDDYDTPDGPVENSKTRQGNATIGAGFYGSKVHAGFSTQIEDARYGIPFAASFEGEEADVDLTVRRYNTRFDVGTRNLNNAVIQNVHATFNYINYRHDELEVEDGLDTLGTRFRNKSFVARAEATQSQVGRLSGRFGIAAWNRDYEAIGAEALAPKTKQNAFAGFVYEELSLGRTRVQFGGRIERNDYDPEAREVGDEAPAAPGAEEEPEPPEATPRDFTGFSGSAGVHFDLSSNTAFVANLSHSYRAPALEELYNFGPHIGNLAFEIGNPDLEAEKTLGLDFSIRGRTNRLKAEFNVYYYDINNFVFPAVTDEELDGLRVALFDQDDSRFVGYDATGSFELVPQTWLHVNLGYVNAKLTDSDLPLPRIPPLHGRLQVDVPIKRWITVSPELSWAAKQDRLFLNETETDGYAVFNIGAWYVMAKSHITHQITLRAFNLTNELYRNHTSFIKDLAPEIGRGVKVTYALRFF